MKRATCYVAVMVLVSMGVAARADEAMAKRPYLLSCGVSAYYSDNRDSVESDKTGHTDLSVWAAMDLLLERADCYMLDFGYRPTVLYRTNPSDTQNDTELYHDLKLDGWYKPSRQVRLHAGDFLNYTDDPSVDVGGGTIRRDASFLLNRANAGVEVDLSRRMRADLSGYSMVKRYDDDTYAVIGDEDSLSSTLALGWIVDRMSLLSLYGSYGVFNYPGDAVGTDRGFGYVEVGVSMRKEFSKKFQGRADVAFKRLDYDASELGSDQSPAAYATVQYTPSPRVRVSGSAGYVLRDADVQFFASQRYTDTSLRAEWDALAPKRLTIGVSGGYRVGDYRSDALLVADIPVVPSVKGQEKTTITGADVTYRLKDWLAVTVLAQYEDVSSDVSTSFNRTSAGIQTKMDF